jgi:hypothetical protein
MERITEAQCSGDGPRYGVHFSTIHQHDACNHTLHGYVTVDGEEMWFTVDSGNWNGFVVRAYGTIDEVSPYDPPKPTRFFLVPTNDNLETDRPGMYKVYLLWTKEKWFQEILSGYHYDRHFQPGGQIENHYRTRAASKGLKIVGEDHAKELHPKAFKK